MHRAKPALLMLGICAAVLFYATGSLLIYQNHLALETLKKEPVSMEIARRVEDGSLLHDSEYIRELAEKLTYYPHQPEMIQRLYALAVLKAPSSHRAFFSYAYYTGARKCCRDRLEYLLQETVRRCPSHPNMHRIAATYFLALDNPEKALALSRRALELDPASAPELFRMLEESGHTVDSIVAVTPETGDALIQLAHYLIRKDPDALRRVLDRLNSMDLSSKQRMKVSWIAFSGGQRASAFRQATLAAADEATRGEALAMQAQILWNEGKREEAAKMADRAEQEYRRQGSIDRAVRYSMEIASLLYNQKETAAAKSRMLRILNDYPGYAPAQFLMARFSRDESGELELFYLRKAKDLAPDNPEYQKTYAKRLLELNRFKEAEAAYAEMLQRDTNDIEAYVGIARCRIAAGNRPAALDILEHAVRREVTSDQIYFQLGQLYASLGEYERSAQAYLDYTRIAANPLDGFLFAGNAYLNSGRYADAREQYRKALARDPSNKKALDALANLDALGY